ncbi:MAG: sigma 54-interacting transcriptional regulator [Polyangiaceae bacterium]|nr:sigma 54-interacting transcriptional regulator [Polyangiaceae bacterium]
MTALDDASTLIGRGRPEGPAAPELLALTIVSHPLARRAGERAVLGVLGGESEAALSRNAPDFVRPGAALGAPLADPFLSRKPWRIAARPGGGVRLGAPEGGAGVSAFGVPLRGEREVSPAELAAGVPIELGHRVALWLHPLGPEPGGAAAAPSPLLGESTGMREARAGVERVAGLDVPVLIRGETGTGKELVARALHERGPRAGRRFVSVNLAAVPKELAAAELFGARRGSFTGASHDRAGFFAAAQGGTLFLDEVGEAPPEVQAMLLRALETGEFYPVGASTPVATDARIVAATDAHLEVQIRDGRFKAPLLHRLAGYEIRLPPLRERREDVGLLFYHFARELLETLGELARLEPPGPDADPWLPTSLAVRLACHDWPGNVRQLRNLARQLVIDSRGAPGLRLDARLARELSATTPAAARPPAPPARGPAASASDAGPAPAESSAAPAPAGGAPSPEPAPRRKPSEIGPDELLAALRESGWGLQAAADRLGISRPSLYDLIEKSPAMRTAGDLSAGEIALAHRECGGNLDAMVRRLQVSRRALARRVRELGLDASDA